MRINCAIPRASLRSVFTVIALQRRLDVTRLDQDRWQPGLDQPRMEPLRHGAGLQPDACDAQPGSRRRKATNASGSLGTLASRTISPVGVDHADAAPFQRHVDRGIVLHGCPSSSMFGAEPSDPVPPSAWGTAASQRRPRRWRGPITASSHCSVRLRGIDRDLICGEHYGPRPRSSAASTGRTHGSTDRPCTTVRDFPCQQGAVHTWLQVTVVGQQSGGA